MPPISNLRFLTGLPPNVEVRRHDVESDDLGETLYDFIHCRAVLMWLREPEKALQRMFSALKPGGRLLAEEMDWGFCDFGGHRMPGGQPTACMSFSSATKLQGYGILISGERSPLMPLALGL